MIGPDGPTGARYARKNERRRAVPRRELLPYGAAQRREPQAWGPYNRSPAMTPSHSQFVMLRGMRHHALTWGDASAPKLFLLHGWMDVGASFQFLVDALTRDWFVVAPDL